jgi:hypothetical protein
MFLSYGYGYTANVSGPIVRLIIVRSSLTLQTLWRHMPNDDLSIVIRLNLDSLRCQGKHRCLLRFQHKGFA